MDSGSDGKGGVDVKNDASGWEKSDATSASLSMGYETFRERMHTNQGRNRPSEFCLRSERRHYNKGDKSETNSKGNILLTALR